MNRADQLLTECCTNWEPPVSESLSEWSEANMWLSSEYSAHEGPLRLYQFQRGILNAYSDPYTRELIVMSATQMVKTLLLQCIVAHTIARDPGPILLAQPTETDAETFSKERLAPMIRDMECLRTRVEPAKKTSSANTILHKVFRGGSLSLVGAQTASNFARRSVRVFLADERDKWPRKVGKEGDGYSLGVQRTRTFRSRAKLVQVCSPTIEGDSQIAAAYERSDQRKFWVPCPSCGRHQVLRWGQVQWEPADPRGTARYRCENDDCGALWNDFDRWSACSSGEWRAERAFAGVAGFHISELVSPWRELGDMVVDYLAKKDDPLLLQTFYNTSLAETWKEKGEAPDYERLMARRENTYRLGEVPEPVLFITAGVDVQKTWLEGYVWGWGRGKQRWVIDHFRIERNPYDPVAWQELSDILGRTYEHASGAEMAIMRMAVDSGYATNEVYTWGRQHGASRVLVVDGRPSGPSLIGQPKQVDITISGKKLRHGCKLWPVNVSMGKHDLYGCLGLDRPAPGEPFPPLWVHFAEDLDEEFFKQLTSESQITRMVNGYPRREWVKDPARRNEALDCAVYARAAAANIGLDKQDFEARCRMFEANLGVRAQQPAEKPQRANPQAVIPSTAVREIGMARSRVIESQDPYL